MDVRWFGLEIVPCLSLNLGPAWNLTCSLHWRQPGSYMSRSLSPAWVSTWAQDGPQINWAQHGFQPGPSIDLSLGPGGISAWALDASRSGRESSSFRGLAPAPGSFENTRNMLIRYLSVSDFWGGRPPGKRKQGPLFPISGGALLRGR